MRRTALILLVSVGAGAASAQDYLRDRPPAKDGFSYPDCYCTNRGERVELGESSCLRVDGREFTALCGMSTNNTAWRHVRDGCAPEGLSRLAPAAPPASAPPARG